MFMALAVAECLDWSDAPLRNKTGNMGWLGKRGAMGKTIVSIDKDLRVAFMRKLWPGPANWMSNACFVIATIHQLLAANLAIDIKNTRAMAINT